MTSDETRPDRCTHPEHAHPTKEITMPEATNQNDPSAADRLIEDSRADAILNGPGGTIPPRKYPEEVVYGDDA